MDRKRLDVTPVKRTKTLPLDRDLKWLDPVQVCVEFTERLPLENIPDTVEQPHPVDLGQMHQVRHVLRRIYRRVIAQSPGDEYPGGMYLLARFGMNEFLVDRGAGRNQADAEPLLDPAVSCVPGVGSGSEYRGKRKIQCPPSTGKQVKVLGFLELGQFIETEILILRALIVILVLLVFHVSEPDFRATRKRPCLLPFTPFTTRLRVELPRPIKYLRQPGKRPPQNQPAILRVPYVP